MFVMVKKNKKIFYQNKIFLIPSVILAAFLILVVLEKTNITDIIRLPGRDTPTTQNGPTPEQLQQDAKVNNDEKQNFIEKDGGNTESPTQQPNNNSVSLRAQQEANGTVTVFTSLEGFSEGRCELSVVNGTQKITRSTHIIYSTQSSTCAGFSIPINEIGKGTWSLQLTATDTVSNTSLNKNIQFEVK